MGGFKHKAVVVVTYAAAVAQAGALKPRAAEPGTWKDWTCPLPLTVSLSFTEYIPVTTTQIQISPTSIYQTITQPTTIFQTIISTEIVTVVSTSPPFVKVA
jgi:hypothetical protein